MKTYASTSDYEERYGAVADTERLSQCLADATRLIDSVLEFHGRDPWQVDKGRLMQVCRSAASRIYDDAGDAPAGIKQYTMSATPYSESFTYSNPNLDAYLTKAEKQMLGIGRARLSSVAVGWC